MNSTDTKDLEKIYYGQKISKNTLYILANFLFPQTLAAAIDCCRMLYIFSS